jgi:hypothetical protein
VWYAPGPSVAREKRDYYPGLVTLQPQVALVCRIFNSSLPILVIAKVVESDSPYLRNPSKEGASEYSGQLEVYKMMLKKIFYKKVIKQMIYNVVQGLIVEIG